MLSAKKLTILLVLPLALAACDSFGKKKKDIIPGERISVLALEKQLEPDPDLASLQVTLPPPAVNADWPQASGGPTRSVIPRMHRSRSSECPPDRRRSASSKDGTSWLNRRHFVSLFQRWTCSA